MKYAKVTQLVLVLAPIVQFDSDSEYSVSVADKYHDCMKHWDIKLLFIPPVSITVGFF